VSGGDLKKHEMQHTGEKPFGCPKCSYRAAGMDSIHRHFASIHANKVRAGCACRGEGGDMCRLRWGLHEGWWL
jgi:hypothetical protein